MNRDTYERAEMEVIEFDGKDIITDSEYELPFVPSNQH